MISIHSSDNNSLDLTKSVRMPIPLKAHASLSGAESGSLSERSLWIPSRILPSFVSALMVFPIIWSHVDAGLAAVDERLTEMASVFGMKEREIMWKIRFPLMAPTLRTGCLTGIGIAWKSGIAAEVICSPTGSIGSMLQGAKAAIDYERVFAVTMMVVLLSLLFENVLKLVWKEQKR